MDDLGLAIREMAAQEHPLFAVVRTAFEPVCQVSGCQIGTPPRGAFEYGHDAPVPGLSDMEFVEGYRALEDAGQAAVKTIPPLRTVMADPVVLEVMGYMPSKPEGEAVKITNRGMAYNGPPAPFGADGRENFGSDSVALPVAIDAGPAKPALPARALRFGVP